MWAVQLLIAIVTSCPQNTVRLLVSASTASSRRARHKNIFYSSGPKATVFPCLRLSPVHVSGLIQLCADAAHRPKHTTRRLIYDDVHGSMDGMEVVQTPEVSLEIRGLTTDCILCLAPARCSAPGLAIVRARSTLESSKSTNGLLTLCNVHVEHFEAIWSKII